VSIRTPLPLGIVADGRLFELLVIQNDAISRMKGNWIHDIKVSLGPEFFNAQAQVALTVLNVLSGSLSLDSPLPPFLITPANISFRALVLERMPQELALEHVGENGFSVFAALAVSSRMIGLEVQKCVALVRSLVGDVDLGWHTEEKKDL
jgi:hypothetical protein